MRQKDLATLEFPRVLEAIATRTRSEPGRRAVLALHPASERAEAEHRLEIVSELITLGREAGRPPTAGVPTMETILAAAQPEGAALEAGRLATVRDFLAAAEAARAYLGRDGTRFPHALALGASLPEVPVLERALASTLDAHGQIRDEASPALAAARAQVRVLRAELEARLVHLVRDPDTNEAIAEDYITIRNGRFVVPVRTAAAASMSGVVQDRSASGETVFVEPLFAVALNNRLLLAARDEDAAERAVRAELTATLRAHAPLLAALEEQLGLIDAYGAAADFAAEHGCTRPTLGAEDVRLPAARHPLLAAGGRRVVPIDLLIPADRRGLAVTGPNAGGKTVALKTLGLCVLMAESGLFVPAAEGARLPWLDAVLADIGDEQSIDRDLSTFSAHAENLARIARETAPGTLVILDEPGAGTDPVEGAALAVGVLSDLLARGPLLAFTSHFPQVKTFALAEPGLEVAAFDVDPTSGAPRFQLAYHAVGQSLALPIARRHGIPERALEAAERLLAGESRDLARAMARLEESRRALDLRGEAVEVERAGLAAARAEAEVLVGDLRARQRRRWTDDLEESRRFLRDLEARGKAVLEELRRRPDPGALRDFVRETEGALAERSTQLAEPTPPGQPPVPGDTVEVAGRGIRGELLEVNGERARIQRGGLKFEVPANQLRVVAPPAPRERVAVALAEPTAAVGELNLIGRRAREAIDTLSGFLDRAMRAGLSEVRVVHGFGTGALRQAVHEFLATSPYCASYREADPTAGGRAVTIAELK